MDSLSQRDNNIYLPREQLSSPKTPSTSLDVDFHDVFGGPPRRSSIQDWRGSSSSGNVSGEEERVFYPRDPWSGLSEKPVFGDKESSTSSTRSNKKYPSDDFFDDIFRGDENSSPRKLGRDPFSSSPASKLSSPAARSLSFQSESFRVSSLPLPPVLSLPVKLAKEMDSSAFPAQSRNPRKSKETALIGFPSTSGASTSRFSIQVTQGQEGLKNDSRTSHRQSSLSKKVSLNSDRSVPASKSDQYGREDHSKEDLSTSEVANNSTQFHFSIYKWASAVVPIEMPLRGGNMSSSKESSKTDNIVNGHAASNLLGVELSSGNNNLLAENASFRGPQKNQDDKSVLSRKSDLIDSSEFVEQVVSAKPEPKPLSNLQNIFKRVQGNLLSQNAGNDIKTGSGASGVEIGSIGGFLEKKMPTSKKESPKAEESLSCILKENQPGSAALAVENGSIEDTEKRMPISNTGLPKSEDPLYCLLKEINNDSDASGADKDLFGGSDKRKPISKKETPKSNESLYFLLKDDSKRQGNGKASAKKGSVRSTHTPAGDVGKDKKVKKQTGKRNILNVAEATSTVVQEVPLSVEDKTVNNKVKGKVKDFVKIFTQEAPSKSLTNVETRDQGDTATDIGAGRAEDQSSVFATKADQKNSTTLTDTPASKAEDQASVFATQADQKNSTTLKDTPGSADKTSKPYAKPQREIKTADQIFEFSFERNNDSASCSEAVFENFEIGVGNVEEFCEDFDCTVEELSPAQNNQPQAGQNYEEIQASDARIRKWSNGKEGNIRSLLSTLQYVLWPESGWKTVPLVDIIEGSSVRKAYQKALLCLHPDKLQQKGAAQHQKYIAEKVFDILQEAWTHFNSLGSF